jgi:hypothetical protein
VTATTLTRTTTRPRRRFAATFGALTVAVTFDPNALSPDVGEDYDGSDFTIPEVTECTLELLRLVDLAETPAP